MANFVIDASNSVTTTTDGVHAFAGDTPGADSLTVEQNGYLHAKGVGSAGAFLANTGAWKVTVGGLIKSDLHYALWLSTLLNSTVKIGATGEVSGVVGITLDGPAAIGNAGTIAGSVYGIYNLNGGNSPFTLKNTGVISGGALSIVDLVGVSNITNSGTLNGSVSLFNKNDVLTNSGTINGAVDLGADDDRLTNSGTINGSVSAGDGNDLVANSKTITGTVNLGGGNDRLTNTGLIEGNVFMGDGDDIVTNKGRAFGLFDLGAGDDTFTGGNNRDIVMDGAGADIIKLGGGDDVYLAVNSGGDGIDTIDGGKGVADLYHAGGAANAVYINLDSVAHDASPFAPGIGVVAANTAFGLDIAGVGNHDRIFGFENAFGGAGNDFIYGNSAANQLHGGSGNDTVFGFGGDDLLFGGDGDDVLCGGAGRDHLTGGYGSDHFRFASVQDSGVTATTRDTINDFRNAEDIIDLYHIDANTTNGAGNDAFTFIGNNQAFTGQAGQLRAYKTDFGLIVEGDVNGDSKADFSIELWDPSRTITLTANDFIL